MALREEKWYTSTQRLFNKQPLIKFKKNHKISSIDDIIYWAIVKGEPTYYTLNDMRQCSSNRRRSAEDIYLLCKNYGITTTLKQVDSALDVLSPTVAWNAEWYRTPIAEREMIAPLNRHHCHVVNRMVHHKDYSNSWKGVTKAKFNQIITNVRNKNNASS